MEINIAEQQKILTEIKNITKNYRKSSRINNTPRYRQSRLEILSNHKDNFERIHGKLIPHIKQNESIQTLYNELNKKYAEIVNLINQYNTTTHTETQVDALIDILLKHLKGNLNPDEYENIQGLVESFESEDTTGVELYESLLDNTLTYYAKREENLIQENTTLKTTLEAQKLLTNKLISESDNSDIESRIQTQLLEKLQKEKTDLYKKIKNLKIKLNENTDEQLIKKLTDNESSIQKKNSQITDLELLLEKTKTLHKQSIQILQADNTQLLKNIIELKQKTFKMSETLQDISKQVNSVIPIFTGEKNSHLITELNIFLDTCKIVHDSLSAGGQGTFMKYIPTRCRGDAYDLITRRNFTNFIEFSKVLTDTYLPLKSVRDFKEELHRCSQRPGETLTEYGDRLKRVLWDCIRCIEGKYRDNNSAFLKEIEIEAIDVFRAGINNQSVRHYLLTIKSENLEEVIKEAIYFERVDNRYKITDKNTLESTISHIGQQPYLQGQHCNCPQQHQSFIHSNDHQQEPQNIQTMRFEPRQTHNYGIAKTTTYGLANSTLQFNPNIRQEVGHQNDQKRWSMRQGSFQNTNRNNNTNGNFFRSRIDHSQDYPAYKNLSNWRTAKCGYCGISGHMLEECRRRQNMCNLCGKTGHFVSDCSQSGKINENTNTNTNICGFCGRNGHDMAQCEFKKQWETNQNGTRNQEN